MGKAEDVGAGDEVVEVGAAAAHLDEEVWDGFECVEDGVGVVVHEVEQGVGVGHGEGEGTGGGVEHAGVEVDLHEGALAAVAGEEAVEAREGCLEWRRLGSPGILPVLTVS